MAFLHVARWVGNGHFASFDTQGRLHPRSAPPGRGRDAWVWVWGAEWGGTGACSSVRGWGGGAVGMMESSCGTRTAAPPAAPARLPLGAWRPHGACCGQGQGQGQDGPPALQAAAPVRMPLGACCLLWPGRPTCPAQETFALVAPHPPTPCPGLSHSTPTPTPAPCMPPHPTPWDRCVVVERAQAGWRGWRRLRTTAASSSCCVGTTRTPVREATSARPSRVVSAVRSGPAAGSLCI